MYSVYTCADFLATLHVQGATEIPMNSLRSYVGIQKISKLHHSMYELHSNATIYWEVPRKESYKVVLLILALRSHRELAVRLLSEAIQHVTSYAEFELLLEIAFALANDHGMTPLSCTSFPLC